MIIFNYYLLTINICQFLIMGLDKLLAIKKKNRISEKTLLLNALIGGSIGAILGMYTFRHKTKKLKFTVGMPTILIAEIAAVIYIAIKYVVLG